MLFCLFCLTTIFHTILADVGSLPDDDSGTDDIDSDKCRSRGSCLRNVTTKLNTNSKNCQCDDQCLVYNDCCRDFIASDTQKKPIAKGTLSCVAAEGRGGSFSSGKQIGRLYVVKRCPDDFADESIRRLCQEPPDDPLLSVPVSDVSTNVLYGNYICAVCHGAQTPLFWIVTVKCYGDAAEAVSIGSLRQTLELPQHKCSRFFDPPNENITVRVCQQTKEFCPERWSGPKDVVEQCSNHVNYVYHSSGVYRNKFCAACYGIEENELSCEPPDSAVVSVAFQNERGWKPPSFRVMMDLNSGLVGVEQKSVSSEEKIFRRRCPDRRVYDPYLGLCRSLTCPRGERLAANGSFCVRDVFQKAYTGRLGSHDLAVNKPVDMRELSVEPPVGDNNATCAKIGYNSSEYILWDNGTALLHDQAYKPGEYTINDRLLYVCRPDKMTNNYTVVINVTSENVALNYDDIESILTTVGLTISLFCLALSILVHSVYPALRNTAGKCIIGLSVSLFTGQLLFLTATSVPNHEACYVFAVVLHYAFLAAFCWTNCLSIDICLAFSSSCGFNGGSSNRFKKYAFYACSVPFLFVLFSILTDFLPSIPDLYQPHYGEHYCLINRSGALLVSFALPVACILSVNLVLFIITTRSIYVSKKLAMFALTEKRRRAKVVDFVLYTKLYVIMGLTWLIGFLAAVVDKTPLWYAFIIFNTLQGAFLCFAFVFTKKTAKMFRERTISWATRSTRLTSRTAYSRSASDSKPRQSF